MNINFTIQGEVGLIRQSGSIHILRYVTNLQMYNYLHAYITLLPYCQQYDSFSDHSSDEQVTRRNDANGTRDHEVKSAKHREDRIIRA